MMHGTTSLKFILWLFQLKQTENTHKQTHNVISSCLVINL